jgi:hypothetical protein
MRTTLLIKFLLVMLVADVGSILITRAVILWHDNMRSASVYFAIGFILSMLDLGLVIYFS